MKNSRLYICIYIYNFFSIQTKRADFFLYIRLRIKFICSKSIATWTRISVFGFWISNNISIVCSYKTAEDFDFQLLSRESYSEVLKQWIQYLNFMRKFVGKLPYKMFKKLIKYIKNKIKWLSNTKLMKYY